MSLAGSQQRTLLSLLAQLRPHWRHDRALPARLQALLAGDRRFGSRDRRLYRELVYTTLRYLPWLEPELDRDADRATRLIAWLAAEIPATSRLRAELLTDWPPCPTALTEKSVVLRQRFSVESSAAAAFDPAVLLPDWFREQCPAASAVNQLETLLARAPLWLRIQTSDLAVVQREFDQLGWRWQPALVLPSAMQLFAEVDVTQTTSYAAGLIEVQDLGSQLLLEAAGIMPGERWLDACAGAGGKTLQLAFLLGPAGSIDAFDVRGRALEELAVRAQRAGLRFMGRRPTHRPTAPTRSLDAPAKALPAAPVQIIDHLDETAQYDGVLVDAPCSGSGTWRRAPHLKWATSPARIETAATLQRELLARCARKVRPGGRLLYATCSMARAENEDVVADFLSAHPAFRPEPPARDFGAGSGELGLTLLPALHNTDGFFLATLRRDGSNSGAVAVENSTDAGAT